MTHYGRTRISRILKRIEALRRAIRSEGTPAIQEAWDAMEPFVHVFCERVKK